MENFQRQALENLSVQDLKAACRVLELSRYSRLRKTELINLLLDYNRNSPQRFPDIVRLHDIIPPQHAEYRLPDNDREIIVINDDDENNVINEQNRDSTTTENCCICLENTQCIPYCTTCTAKGCATCFNRITSCPLCRTPKPNQQRNLRPRRQIIRHRREIVVINDFDEDGEYEWHDIIYNDFDDDFDNYDEFMMRIMNS